MKAHRQAIMRAMDMVPDGELFVISSCSHFALDCVEIFIPAWKRQGYTHDSGYPIHDSDLIGLLDFKLMERTVRPTFVKVQPGRGNGHNERARMSVPGR